MALHQNLALTLNALKAYNFPQYLQRLEALGVDISTFLQASSIKQLVAKKLPTETLPQINPNDSDFSPNLSAEELLQLYSAAECFARIWHRGNGGANLKQNLNASTRHYVHLGELAVQQWLTSKLSLHPNAPPKIDLETFQSHEKNISAAISHHQTSKQKLINMLGKALVTAASFCFGMVQTSVAVFFVGLLFFTPSGLFALGAWLAFALSCGGVFSYINYCTQKDDIPYLMNEIAGYDRWFQGFLQFNNAKGEKEPLTKKQVVALSIFTALFALPASIASGAFGFTSALSIPTILSMFGIVGTASLFTPIAIGVAAIIAFTMTLYMLRSFHAFIAYDHGNLLNFLRKPFDETASIINEKIDKQNHPKLNTLGKVIGLAVCGLFCTMATAGLAISSLAGINSVTALATKLFQTSFMVSAGIGIAVGGVLSFISRSFFTIKKCSNAFVNLLKVACHKTEAQVNKLGLVAGIVIDLPLAAFFWLDAFLRPPAVVPLLPMPSTMKAAALATTCTTAKDAGLIINSMLQEKKPEFVKESTTADRDSFCERVAEHKTYVSIPASLQDYSLFKPVSTPATEINPLSNHPILKPHFS